MENETPKPEAKSNLTKVIETVLGTATDPNGKGSSSRMTLFTSVWAMIFIMIAQQIYGFKANMEIFSTFAAIVIALLGLNGPIIQIMEALGKLIQIIKGVKPEVKNEDIK